MRASHSRPMGDPRLAVLPALVCAVLAAPSAAVAQEPGSPGAPSAEPVEWKPHWHRANWWDAAVIGGGWSLFFAEATIIPRSEEANWRGPILFDSAVRDLLRANTRGNRRTAATISDVMLTGSLVHNWAFDNLFVTLALHREPDVAWQMSVVNAEAYAVSFGLTSLVKNLAGRERPYVEECARDPEYLDKCDGAGLRSFYSGHAAATATGAGLLCAHHTNLPLYDGRILDYGICGVGVALTLVTAAMRIAGDRHYASDVLMGHAVGFSSGYFIPTLLYYKDPEPEADDAVLLPSLSPEQLGVSLLGRW